jgi:sterol 3beta-glucosyltransferase
MIIPVHDILNSENSRAFHFGHYGLVLNLRGYEELFFEFGHEERRRAFAALLDKRKEEVLRRQREAGEQATEEDSGALALTRPLIFEDFEPGSSSSVHEADTTSASAISAHDGTDPMFTSASSTFLRFKPERPLHFTFLTIGSRGDVQPYIALAKGLMADGHKVRIATHGEFREWIEAVSFCAVRGS